MEPPIDGARAVGFDMIFGPQSYHRLPEMVAKLARGTGAVLNAIGAAVKSIYPQDGYHTEDVAEGAKIERTDIQVLALADLFEERLERCHHNLARLEHSPDRQRNMECEGFPDACIAPFHFANSGSGPGGEQRDHGSRAGGRWNDRWCEFHFLQTAQRDCCPKYNRHYPQPAFDRTSYNLSVAAYPVR